MAEIRKTSIFSNDVYHSVPSAARQLQVHHCTLRRAIGRGDLPVVRVGRTIRIAESALKRFVNRRKGK